jgi:RNA polymerase sigma-70 factor (ECF subfamily)
VLREVIQLRDFDGLNTSEAAHLLGVPEGTIKARVWRARAQLKRRASLGLDRKPLLATSRGLGSPRIASS